MSALKQMEYLLFEQSLTKPVIGLFKQVFSNSDGETEGRVIGNLVETLINTTHKDELIGFVAIENQRVCGSIFFSRFWLANDQIAYILSPVAIATAYQGRGIGQELITFGLEYLKLRNIELVLTYGDPAFYCKVGFESVSEEVIQAPFKLSQPIGWQVQSLNNNLIMPIKGISRCVNALSDQKYW